MTQALSADMIRRVLRGERIKELRQSLKLTQVQLADRAKVDQGNLSKIERGKRPNKNISADAVRRLASALNTTTDELLTADTPGLHSLPEGIADGPDPSAPEEVAIRWALESGKMTPEEESSFRDFLSKKGKEFATLDDAGEALAMFVRDHRKSHSRLASIWADVVDGKGEIAGAAGKRHVAAQAAEDRALDASETKQKRGTK